MPTNDIQPFATGGGATVMNQADYLAAAWRSTGFQAGIADPLQLNKVWRQSAFMASVLASFIVAETGQDLLDDGNTTTALTKLTAAVQAAMLIAAQADMDAGTNNTKAVTPLDLAYAVQHNKYRFARDVSLAGNTPNLVLSPTISVPTDGMVVVYVHGHDNTGASTITIGSGSAFSIKYQGADVSAGQLKGGHAYSIMFDGNNNWWQLISPPG